MNGFQNLPVETNSLDGENFILAKELVYRNKFGDVYTVPVGCATDGASTPRLIWRLIPPFGSYWPAAILHDWAYRYSDLAKDECDNLLLEAMESLNVPHLERMTIYEGVRLGGGHAFAEDRKNRTP